MIVYSDIDPLFKKTKSGDTNIVVDHYAVIASIDNILGINFRERVMLPEFGAKLEGYLFEILDDMTAHKIRTEILRAILKWEKRVVVKNITVNPSYDDNSYYIYIEYEIKGLEGLAGGEYHRKLVI